MSPPTYTMVGSETVRYTALYHTVGAAEYRAVYSVIDYVAKSSRCYCATRLEMQRDDTYVCVPVLLAVHGGKHSAVCSPTCVLDGPDRARRFALHEPHDEPAERAPVQASQSRADFAGRHAAHGSPERLIHARMRPKLTRPERPPSPPCAHRVHPA